MQAGLEKYLGSHGERETWPFNEAQSAVRVERHIAQVVQLDSVSQDVQRSVFIETVREDLSTQNLRNGGRSGVFVGTLGEAIGAPFDAVVVCGMAEGLIPLPPQKNGLLSALTVPGEEARGERDMRAFRLRMDGGGYRMLTSPAADVRRQRPMRPSVFLLEEAARLAGRPVDADEFARNNAEWPWLQVFSSFTQIVARPQLQSSIQFDDLGSLHHFTKGGGDCSDADVVVDAGTYKAGIDLLRDRDSAEFTRHDGLLGAFVALGGVESAPLRVTQLERWAQCPFRYFMESVLLVEHDDDDDSILSMSPRDRGEVIHSILETFIRNVAPRTAADQPWNDEERAMLHGIVDDQFATAVSRGIAPDGFTTDVQRKALPSPARSTFG